MDICQASPTDMRALIELFVLCITNTAEHIIIQSNIHHNEAVCIREEHDVHKISQTDGRVFTKARAITGQEVLRITAVRQEKDRVKVKMLKRNGIK